MQVFGQELPQSCGPQTIFLGNDSWLPISAYAQDLGDGRFVGTGHFFFPAHQNIQLELEGAEWCDPRIEDELRAWFEARGMFVPRVDCSQYGFALDPIFSGLLMPAAHAVQQGWGTIKQVDAVMKRCLGMGVGPFEGQNLTGGTGLSAHGLRELAGELRRSHDFETGYSCPDMVAKAAAENPRYQWPVAKRGEAVDMTGCNVTAIESLATGFYLLVTGDAHDRGVMTPQDLEASLRCGLQCIEPSRLFAQDRSGARQLMEKAIEIFPGFDLPYFWTRKIRTGITVTEQDVLRRDEDGVAILTLSRPGVMNALAASTYAGLHGHLDEIEVDRGVRALQIEGRGPHFCAGADIPSFVGLGAEAARLVSSKAQLLGQRIRSLGIPTAGILRGLALGGGFELLLWLDAIFADHTARAGFPELEHLGIIPGAGGCVTFPRKVRDVGVALQIMRSGRHIKAKEGSDLGIFTVDADPRRSAQEFFYGWTSELGKQPVFRTEPFGSGDLPDREDLFGTVSGVDPRADLLLINTVLTCAWQDVREALDTENRAFKEVWSYDSRVEGFAAHIEGRKPKWKEQPAPAAS